MDPTVTVTAIPTDSPTPMATAVVQYVVQQLSDGSNASDALVTVVLCGFVLVVFAVGFFMWAHLPLGDR